MTHRAQWWTPTEEGRYRCELCPRLCTLRPGQRAFCYVRSADASGIVLETYGRSSGFCIDPIEKKPLNHFLPGTSVLSFGTAGCNLGCRFCQNWDISKARTQDRLTDRASPEAIAQAAVDHGCRSVAFTYNDPTIFAEYAIDIAQACRERGVETVAVTAGYIMPEPRAAFFGAMSAANIDLKAFTEDFYEQTCFARLGPVLETLEWVVHHSDTWLEITTLLIPGMNDSDAELDRMTGWIAEHLSPTVPLHFTAFHPDFKLDDRPRTPLSTLLRARQIARANGLQFVYTGNVHHPDTATTWCPGCGACLIERDWYALGRWGLEDGRCCGCGLRIPGVFDKKPGNWGRRRQRVALAR